MKVRIRKSRKKIREEKLETAIKTTDGNNNNKGRLASQTSALGGLAGLEARFGDSLGASKQVIRSRGRSGTQNHCIFSNGEGNNSFVWARLWESWIYLLFN